MRWVDQGWLARAWRRVAVDMWEPFVQTIQQEAPQVRIPIKSDTDSDSIRTGFRRKSDSVPIRSGQFLGAKRRAGSPSTPARFASQARAASLPKVRRGQGGVVGRKTGPQWE